MCTYNISISDALMEQVRPAFTDDHAISSWMQEQMEQMLIQMAVQIESRKHSGMRLSQRLRGIAHAPEGFDYKAELANRYQK